MPWQELVAMIGGELDPETGLPAFREIVITVPRQSGKTTVVLAWEVQRARGWRKGYGPQRIVYSAQTGSDARTKLVEDQFPILEPRKTKLGIRKLLRANGNEGVMFNNGSRIGLMASTEDAGHGPSVDLGIEDELFADTDDRRDQALIPAMATKDAGQILKASTMGTEESVALNAVVARGRSAVERGVRSGIAYFEWSAPLDADPDDPKVWAACMPALGYTISVPVVQQARNQMKDGEFRRAFLNQPTKAEDRVIPQATWDAVCDPNVSPAAAIVFALDMSPERNAASISAASRGDVPYVELIDWREGTGGLVDRAVELGGRWGSPVWWVDQTGPAASLIPEMTARGLRVHAAAARELVGACGAFYDRVHQGRVRVRKHPRLDTAVAGAAKRQVGDAWAWARKNTSIDVSPLISATLATWGATSPEEGEEEVIEPFFVTS